MRQLLRAGRRRSQRGSVAVETAIVLPFLVLFVLFPSLFWAMYFYRYSAAQKAVHDASLYLSTAPRLEMTTAGPDGNPAALTVANKIIAKEMAGMSPPAAGIVCSYQQASGLAIPKPCTTINNKASSQTLVGFYVSIGMSYIDPLTGSDSGMTISPYADVAYTGD